MEVDPVVETIDGTPEVPAAPHDSTGEPRDYGDIIFKNEHKTVLYCVILCPN